MATNDENEGKKPATETESKWGIPKEGASYHDSNWTDEFGNWKVPSRSGQNRSNRRHDNNYGRDGGNGRRDGNAYNRKTDYASSAGNYGNDRERVENRNASKDDHRNDNYNNDSRNSRDNNNSRSSRSNSYGPTPFQRERQEYKPYEKDRNYNRYSDRRSRSSERVNRRSRSRDRKPYEAPRRSPHSSDNDRNGYAQSRGHNATASREQSHRPEISRSPPVTSTRSKSPTGSSITTRKTWRGEFRKSAQHLFKYTAKLLKGPSIPLDLPEILDTTSLPRSDDWEKYVKPKIAKACLFEISPEAGQEDMLKGFINYLQVEKKPPRMGRHSADKLEIFFIPGDQAAAKHCSFYSKESLLAIAVKKQ